NGGVTGLLPAAPPAGRPSRVRGAPAAHLYSTGMPRALTVGNGRLLINLDEGGRLRDIYWPSVGAEHHAGTPSRLGFWVDGEFAWFDSFVGGVAYEPDTLVTDLAGRHEGLGVEVRIRD